MKKVILFSIIFSVLVIGMYAGLLFRDPKNCRDFRAKEAFKANPLRFHLFDRDHDGKPCKNIK